MDKVKELEIAMKNMQVAMENAQEQVQIAIDKINQIKAEHQADVYMKTFDAFLGKITGGN